jgi:hypothetical protein
MFNFEDKLSLAIRPIQHLPVRDRGKRLARSAFPARRFVRNPWA